MLTRFRQQIVDWCRIGREVTGMAKKGKKDKKGKKGKGKKKK
jgi:hypothetical protein